MLTLLFVVLSSSDSTGTLTRVSQSVLQPEGSSRPTRDEPGCAVSDQGLPQRDLSLKLTFGIICRWRRVPLRVLLIQRLEVSLERNSASAIRTRAEARQHQTSAPGAGAARRAVVPDDVEAWSVRWVALHPSRSWPAMPGMPTSSGSRSTGRRCTSSRRRSRAGRRPTGSSCGDRPPR